MDIQNEFCSRPFWIPSCKDQNVRHVVYVDQVIVEVFVTPLKENRSSDQESQESPGISPLPSLVSVSSLNPVCGDTADLLRTHRNIVTGQCNHLDLIAAPYDTLCVHPA